MTKPFSIEQLKSWAPDDRFKTLTTIDAHTGGEPLRIITGGLPNIPGTTILEKRKYMRSSLDHYRRILMWEPRGHADMYGCILTPPVNDGSDFGVIFMHNEGYSTMCGHGIIAITKVALECGLTPIKTAITEVRIDSPAGLIRAKATIVQNQVQKVSFLNVPSYVQALDQKIEVEGLGEIRYDLAFGGAFYAYVNAKDAQVSLDGDHFNELITKGMMIKRAVMKSVELQHPFEKDLNFLYGTIFIDDPTNKNADSRNVCIFAEGEVDRSPTGTGVSGRVAIEVAKGKLKLGESMTIESILGTTFTCKAKEAINFGKYPAVIPEVEGTAFITGLHTFIIDPTDPLKDGFILR